MEWSSHLATVPPPGLELYPQIPIPTVQETLARGSYAGPGTTWLLSAGVTNSPLTLMIEPDAREK